MTQSRRPRRAAAGVPGRRHRRPRAAGRPAGRPPARCRGRRRRSARWPPRSAAVAVGAGADRRRRSAPAGRAAPTSPTAAGRWSRRCCSPLLTARRAGAVRAGAAGRRRAGGRVLLPARLLDDRRRGARRRRRPDHPDRGAGDADPAAVRAGRPAPVGSAWPAPTAPRSRSSWSAWWPPRSPCSAPPCSTRPPARCTWTGCGRRRRRPALVDRRWPRSAVALVVARARVQGGRGAVARLGAGHLRRRAAAGGRVPVHRLQAGRRGRPAVVAAIALPAWTTGPVLAVLAVLTMTVGNLVALRQTRMVRLLAWSSVAQAGYILAPLGALALAAAPRRRPWPPRSRTPSSSWCWSSAPSRAVVALRPAGRRRRRRSPTTAAPPAAHPWLGAALVLALVGLAGLPPGLAGLFAKVTVVALADRRRRGLARRGGRAERGDRPGLLRARSPRSLYAGAGRRRGGRPAPRPSVPVAGTVGRRRWP